MSDDLVANTSLKSPDLGLIGDHRGLSKLRQLGRGGKKEQALALKAAAEQFESILNQCLWLKLHDRPEDIFLNHFVFESFY